VLLGLAILWIILLFSGLLAVDYRRAKAESLRREVEQRNSPTLAAPLDDRPDTSLIVRGPCFIHAGTW